MFDLHHWPNLHSHVVAQVGTAAPCDRTLRPHPSVSFYEKGISVKATVVAVRLVLLSPASPGPLFYPHSGEATPGRPGAC